MPYYVNAILNCISEFASIKRDGIVTHTDHHCLYICETCSVSFFLFQFNISDARQNSKEDSESNPLLVPIIYIAGKKANHLEDSETTPKSCFDVEFKLLASSCDTSSAKLPPELVQLL
jgi:hypothetical protein